MASVTYARRYAQAALELAIEHQDLDRWRADLEMLAQLWSDPATRAYFEDVRVSKQARIDRCRARLAESLGPRALNMVLVLLTRGRTSLIPYIARHFQELERNRDQTVIAHVTSATELSDAEQRTIADRLSKETGMVIQLETAVNTSLLGGLVIKVGDQLLDLSIAGKLHRMRDQVVGRRA